MKRGWKHGRIRAAAIAIGLALIASSSPAAEPDAATDTLRDALKDLNVAGADHWIYNDFARAAAQARRTGRPIFVTFRCVPCKACRGFDAEVAQGSDAITRLANEAFVPLRQVEMKGVDLSQFQFDYDLNWAAMFVNADGTVYGRYGTQSAEGPDAYNSTASLEKAMRRVLKLHADYPANAASLRDKKGAPKPYRTALDMPELEQRDKLRGATAANNCIHCHMVHDAEQEQLRKQGRLTSDDLYRYPLPDNIGLHIDRDDGCRIEKVTPGGPAEAAGLRAGDTIARVNGQAIVSIADVQWVLHHLPNQDVSVKVEAERAGKPVEATINLKAGWKKTNFLWRGSRWSLRPRPGFWAPELKPDELRRLELADGARAYCVQWINTGQSEGRKAKEVGLREGDVIVEVADQPVSMTPEQFHMHVRMTHKVGDDLPLTVLRDGRRQRIVLPLVD